MKPAQTTTHVNIFTWGPGEVKMSGCQGSEEEENESKLFLGRDENVLDRGVVVGYCECPKCH